jgi:hypothetical protein
MSDILLGLGIGIILGWNVLPQPAFAKSIYDWVVSKFKKK